MTYTVKALQERRSEALFNGDMAAYWAFDLLIGHALETPHLYTPMNKALNEAKAALQHKAA